MKCEIKYKLPILSQTMEDEPVIMHENMDISLRITGYDDADNLRCFLLKFRIVLCDMHTSEKFTPQLYDAYDAIVELIDSEWLKELGRLNQEDFNYWKLKHYVIYLDKGGMFHFIAQGFEVTELE